MSNEPETIDNIAASIRTAINGGDLRPFRDVLHPNVTWSAPEDASPTCQSDDQVLAWFTRGRTSGTRARVTETVIWHDRILLGLIVTDAKVARELVGKANRWQIYTVRNGMVTEIVGFETREAAFAHAEGR